MCLLVIYNYTLLNRGVARILEKGVLLQMKEGGAKRPIFSRAVKFGWPEATPLINDVISYLPSWCGRTFICIEKLATITKEN